MADNSITDIDRTPKEQVQLQGGTYEIIHSRLRTQCQVLHERISKLNDARKGVFGSIETKLVNSERITTDNNCVARDMVPVGDKFIFGYNVFVGLRSETNLNDIFAVYEWKNSTFTKSSEDLISDKSFQSDLKSLYKYYRHTTFVKFKIIGVHLYMAFRTGKSITDIKVFKWLINGDKLKYIDNRSDHEYIFPPQHEFEWTKVTQDMHCNGENPHASIEDRVFVETINGCLTIKIEDNTETGEGIFSEPVEDSDQTLNDADIYYAIVGNIILLKIQPYNEKTWRYIVYNEKIQQAVRIDAIEEACVLLPEDHGIIFPKGYYLQTGDQKQFDIDMDQMVFEKCISAPNGEEYLYVFYNRLSGVYVLLSYNLIEQQVMTPVVCGGYSFFEDGTLIYFRTDENAQKHHVVQIWQTPYHGSNYNIDIQQDSELYKIGNKDIVKCMAECMELINLIGKEDSYANLYVDISKKSEDIRDSYFWLNSGGTFELSEPLEQIKQTSASAIDEFEKVVRTKNNTRKEITSVNKSVNEALDAIKSETLNEINKFVKHLTTLRTIRGKIVSLRDLRYADEELIGQMEQIVSEKTDSLSSDCVKFLLDPAALDSYSNLVDELASKVPELGKVSQAREFEEQVSNTANELEMLTEIVSNLKIDDATETIKILDNISLVYSQINKVKSALKNKVNNLAGIEGKAEFASQIKLIDQSAINYLDICDSPDKCDEYLTKATVQLESLESKFADFDEFIVTLTEKREELYNAFESRKVELVAKLNQRASALMAAARRILKGVSNRVQSFKKVDEINGYFASDLMIERVRETSKQLNELGDSVKAEDIKSQLKTMQQEAVRQLKDKSALYEEDDSIIRLGENRFSVNNQSLEGTIVNREGKMFFHLTGTGFFEAIEDEKLNETKSVWQMEVVSENNDIYRAEYLAYQMLLDLEKQGYDQVQQFSSLSDKDVIIKVQSFMGPRYNEGYIKGVNDHDAAKILKSLIGMQTSIGLLMYPSNVRALASVFWQLWQSDKKEILAAKISGIGCLQQLFGPGHIKQDYILELKQVISEFVRDNNISAPVSINKVACYLFDELAQGDSIIVSKQADKLKKEFLSHLKLNGFTDRFNSSTKALSSDAISKYRLIHDWVKTYLNQYPEAEVGEYAGEVAATLLDEQNSKRTVIDADIQISLTDMAGSHPLIQNGQYILNYCSFITKLDHHQKHVVPAFEQYQQAKKDVVERFSDQLRLEEFKPKVLSTFVRNKLIDKVYLPLIGDNMAKQIGSAGNNKRTDRQGLLLMISPPGYGKTTLMEYVSNRLGLIFMKINGPAIGSKVTSFDPDEAPNIAARSELEKINLAFEMGDNVMIYLDDIQHTNPELLQKFISLCDAQRRVEGIYKGKAKTYDFRGKRVSVVMAGNPYTESGEKFRIPDMLSNRADTYNIGDIVGDNYNEFIDSYVENSISSNPVLETLTSSSQSDVYSIMKLASGSDRDTVEFQGNYSVDEINEYVDTMKKLNIVREVVLKVNKQYIKSAGQAEEYRTEPPFLLQGSYRNMNSITSRVLPVMNDDELWTLITSSYEQDAQTLTAGAEANMLKFRELIGKLDDEQAKRWNDIKKTFGRNQLLGGDSDDKVSTMIRQFSAFSAGLDSIKEVLSEGVHEITVAKNTKDEVSIQDHVKESFQEVVDRMSEMIAAVKEQNDTSLNRTVQIEKDQRRNNAKTLVSVLEEQFATMETWMVPVTDSEADRVGYFNKLMDRFETMVNGYKHLMNALSHRYDPDGKLRSPNHNISDKTDQKLAEPVDV